MDVSEGVRGLERPGVEILIGDQGSSSFWKDFKEKYPEVDIFIDDGGYKGSG